ncbi:MAG: rhomboid family intramembrane serine protease [Bacteroidales bacterium]
MLQSRGSFFSSIPTVTKNLLIINILMWLASVVLPSALGIDLVKYLGLHYWEASGFNVAQLVTYMFMHDTSGITHLFFNMFSLFIFGRVLENVWGQKRFLFYYLSTGIGAAIIQEIVWMATWQDMFAKMFANMGGLSITEAHEQISYYMAMGKDIPALNSLITVGASGAVFGILLAFGMMFPNAPMYLMFIPVPIKAKYLVIGYGAIELFFGVSGIQGSVAHFAHLGGMLFGLIILLYWKRKGILGGRNF